MHRFPLMKCLFALPAALSIGLLLPVQAEAVDPTNSDLATVEVLPTDGTFFDTVDNRQTRLMGIDECVKAFQDDTELVFNFTLTSAGESAYRTTRVFAVETDDSPPEFACDSVNGFNNCINATNIEEFVVPSDQNASLSWGIFFEDLVLGAVDDLQGTNEIVLLNNADDCRESNVDQQYFLRLIFEEGDVDEEFDAVIELDLERPARPTAVSVDAVTEDTIFLAWTQEETKDLNVGNRQDSTERTITVPFVVFTSNQNINGKSLAELEALEDSGVVFRSLIDVDNLDPDGNEFAGEAEVSDDLATSDSDRVWVAIASRDDVGNVSEPIYPAEQGDEGLVPVPVIDFWEEYKGAGGRETGGCSTTGGPLSSSVALLGLLGLVGWRRRRRLRQAAPVIAAVGAFGLTVAAAPDTHAQSPAWGIAELRIGGYYPSIDDEEGLQGTPFKDIFGSSTRVLVEYEQGVHIFDGFGTFGAMGSFGYTHFGGAALFEEDAPPEVQDVEEEVGFMVVPLRAGLYYRADQFQDYWQVPLVPYAKGGADYFLWQAEQPNGDAGKVDGEEGEGGTWGWHVGAGLQLGLDWIDPTSAAAMDYNWGINHTYAFAEYQIMEVDDFGASDSFILSDDRWVFGLAFEY